MARVQPHLRGRLGQGVDGAQGANGVHDRVVLVEPRPHHAHDQRGEYRLRHAGLHAAAEGPQHRGEPVREDGRLPHARPGAEQEVFPAEARVGLRVAGEGGHGVRSHAKRRRRRHHNAGGSGARLPDHLEHDPRPCQDRCYYTEEEEGICATT